MTSIEADISFVKSILPDHYIVQESKRRGSVHCKSSIGIRHKIDADDNEHWDYICQAIENHFGARLMEIDHNTNFCHVDFTIYLRPYRERTFFAFLPVRIFDEIRWLETVTVRQFYYQGKWRNNQFIDRNNLCT